MNGSFDQRRNEQHDDDLGLGIVDELASTSRAEKSHKPRGWIFAVVGLVVLAVLALVLFSLLNSGATNDTSALKAKDSVSNTLELRSGGKATVTTSESDQAVAVELSGLPALDESERYVVWGIDDEGNTMVLLETAKSADQAGVKDKPALASILVTVETTPTPETPTSESEASVDLPLDPNAPQKDGTTNGDDA
ncbi:anti-sigma factor domain-containing protein [Arthrobacter sp. JCM 19049]|uniref:anti-sigma factor domain-containing protein n=1 Tax=Arthrobacter sp. JCM 19049 TaxID=1460643 RepID=UPI0006D195F5|nr:anti-sigma factor [Arthrobacter sp. JCM 19049]